MNDRITKRELFAAMALQGFAANPEIYLAFTSAEGPANMAVEWADKLIAELAVPATPTADEGGDDDAL